jgi:predicted TIM-barrel fold metal-dependent hydrolase
VGDSLMDAGFRAGPLVDVHVHLYENRDVGLQAKDNYTIWEYGEDPGVDFAPFAGDVEDLADTFGRGGFDRAVVVHLFETALARQEAMARLAPGHSGEEAFEARAVVDEAVAQAMVASNQWVAAVAQSIPMVEVLVTVDPTVLGPAALVDHLVGLADAGVRGIKLHPVSQGYLPDDARLHPIYDICSESGLVVLSHSGPGHRGGASARPSEFVTVLEKWPDLRLVLAHLGGASWRETEALAGSFPHVVFDLSEIIEWVGAPNAPSAPDLTGLIQAIGVDRVMLGSDFPWYDPARTVDRVMSLPGLGAGEKEAILGGNAVRVLGLDRPTVAA